MTTIDAARFRFVLGRFPTGVTVITASGDCDRPLGFAVGSFFSVSLDPPLVGFCAGKASSSWPAIRDAGSFCVNVLAADQEHVCRQFSAKLGDRFAGLECEMRPPRAPRLGGTLAWIDCDIDAVHDAGDHHICIGLICDLGVSREDGPLLFFGSEYGQFAVRTG